MNRFARLFLAGVIATTGMAACTTRTSPTAAPASAIPSVSASAVPTAPSASASPAVMAPSSPAASPTSAPFCSQADDFCVTFDNPTGDKVETYVTTAKTHAGQVRARGYHLESGTAGFVLVYRPRLMDPLKALEADGNWDWEPKVITFKGNPALLVSEPADLAKPGDPHRNVSLKVAHGGKIYVLIMVSPEGLKATEAFRNSLTFTK